MLRRMVLGMGLGNEVSDGGGRCMKRVEEYWGDRDGRGGRELEMCDVQMISNAKHDRAIPISKIRDI